MQRYTLNPVLDTRRGSQTERPSPSVESPEPAPPTPTREEEQRYSQTSEERAEPEAES